MRIRRIFRRMFYKTYLITFLNKKEEIIVDKIHAYSQYHAVIKWRDKCKYDFEIIAITKISKNLGEIL